MRNAQQFLYFKKIEIIGAALQQAPIVSQIFGAALKKKFKFQLKSKIVTLLNTIWIAVPKKILVAMVKEIVTQIKGIARMV